MPDNKHKADAEKIKDSGTEKKKQDTSAIKINPNPRANENIPVNKKKEPSENAGGPGTEITDGEDG